MMYNQPENFHVKVRVYNKEIAFGKGVAQLMRLTETFGSLSAAYKAMGMSSSKAWKILHRAEADLGYTLVTSSSGGRDGGGSCLTPEGIELLARYEAFEQEVQRQAASAFSRHFADAVQADADAGWQP